MRVSLRRVEGALFEARNEDGQTCLIDGPAELGGTGAGLRPMQMVLVSMAGCSGIDVLHIMKKQRQPIEDLDVEVEGTRADAVPAVFTDVHVKFTGSGAIDVSKLQRAADLSMETYCSVARMLAPTVKITHEVAVR